VQACAKTGDLARATIVTDRMQQGGLQHNVQTAACLLATYCSAMATYDHHDSRVALLAECDAIFQQSRGFTVSGDVVRALSPPTLLLQPTPPYTHAHQRRTGDARERERGRERERARAQVSERERGQRAFNPRQHLCTSALPPLFDMARPLTLTAEARCVCVCVLVAAARGV
jgi:hypothetical protein